MRWESDKAVFSYSRLKTLGYIVIGAVFTAGSFWFSLDHAAAPGSFKELVVMLAGPVFGAATLVMIARMLAAPDALIVDRQGMLDRRLSPTLIPWPMILNISSQKVKRFGSLRVELAPEFDATWPRTTLGRLNRASLSDKAIAIGVQGLDGSFDDLLEAVRRYSPQS